MQATSIDEVVQILDGIIETSIREKRRIGYFAALYRTVTIAVKKGIANGEFEDCERMEKLDVVFANRFFEAYFLHRNGKAPTQSWDVTFKTAGVRSPIVLQHLLLGMNAHINLDLGIAAATICPCEKIDEIKNDFSKINEVLASLVDKVQREIGLIDWVFRIIDFILGKLDERIVNFSMGKARDSAWDFAKDLAKCNESNWDQKIADRDTETAKRADQIVHRGLVVRIILRILKFNEMRSIKKIIGILNEK
jgi:hypothetical protein